MLAASLQRRTAARYAGVVRFALLIVAALNVGCASDECTPYIEYSFEPVPNGTYGCIGLSFQGHEQSDRTLLYPLGCTARVEQCSDQQGPYGSRAFYCYTGGGWLEAL